MKKVIALALLYFGMGGILVLAFSSPSQTSFLNPDVEEVRLLTAAQDRQGHVWAVWEGDSGTDVDLYFSRWVEGEWSAAEPVHTRPHAWDRSPSLAVAEDGVLWLAWTSARRESPRESALYVSRWQERRWTAPEAVPLGDITNVAEPVLAAGPEGVIWLAWVGFEEGVDAIFASHWDGSGWSDPRQVSAADNDPSLYDRQPRLAVGTDGYPWLVWVGHQSGIDDEIHASHWTGTDWTGQQMVSQDDETLDVWPTLALDAWGQPWVAWKAQVDDGGETRSRIVLSRWDLDRGMWTSEALVSSAVALEVDESYPVLAADRQGVMSLVWLAEGANDSALAYARWQGAEWSVPSVVQAGVYADEVIPLVEDQDLPLFLWLASRPGADLPVRQATVDSPLVPLENWIDEQQTRSMQPQGIPPIANKYLAFGDSITWGLYPADNPFYPYPSILEDTLDVRVTAQSTVVNAGEPGERTKSGKFRIKDEVVEHLPSYVLIMEGTNDVSNEVPPAESCANLIWMIDEARKSSGVDDVKVMLATIIPRLDDLNDETEEFNQEAVLCALQSLSHVRFCDPWQAFYDYGSWENLFEWWDGYWDTKHPGQEGLQLLADTFYACSLSGFSIKEETTPPTVWVDALPAESDPGPIYVSWNGSDNLSWVVDYDVQVSLNNGAWTDWLLGTAYTGAYYAGAQAGDLVGFHARGRDLVGNQSEWSVSVYTTLVDDVPPDAFMDALPPVTFSPIDLSWGATDGQSAVVAYSVEYRVGLGGTWAPISGLSPTGSTSASFTPSTPQYGQTYYFRASAQDAAGNWSAPSAEVSTVLAQYGLSGTAYNPRHEPVAGASVSLDPAALFVANQGGGGFLAYLAAGGSYDVTVSRPDLYGPLPAMRDVAVSADVSGLTFVLPPPDDAVADGGFEAGDLAAWQPGGTTPPTLTGVAHTGLGAGYLGGAGETASLGQAVTPPAGESPTLSFLVRLDQPGGPGTLQIELANSGVLSPPVTYTLAVDGEDWVHVWYDLDGLVSQPLTLTFHASDTVAILLDEVSLGSSPPGIYQIYLPQVGRN